MPSLVLLLRPVARAAAALLKSAPAAARQPRAGESIEFLSDALTDRGPATGRIEEVKVTGDGLYVVVRFADGQRTLSWDDLEAGGADVRGNLWMVKSHPALFPGAQSRAQAEAGNFKKRAIAWRGMVIRIENEAGTLRSFPGGETRIVFPYGELEDTEGVDGDRVDVIVGPNLETAQFVYVVHQRRVGRWSEYDEDKCVLGALSEDEAAQIFLANYDDARFLGPITTLAVDEFVAKARATLARPQMIKAWSHFGDADLLKATAKKMITVPGYFKADGSYIAPHQKAVHYNPTHDLEKIAQGGVSHSQKEAHKKLSKEEWFHKLDTFEQASHVMAHATDIQDAASASAAISGWKAAAKTGKNPTAAQWLAFHALPKEKQGKLYDEVAAAGKSLAHLKPTTGLEPFQNPADAVTASKAPTIEELEHMIASAPVAPPAAVPPITVPTQTGKTGPTTFPPPPDFQTYEEVQQWAAARAKTLGLSKIAFTSSYEYAYAFPSIKAVWNVHKAEWEKEQAAKGAKVLEQMKAGGIALGDSVAWTSTGAFMTSAKYEGVVKLRHGMPVVQLAQEVAVAKPGGKIAYTKTIAWEPFMKKKGAATPAPDPEEVKSARAKAAMIKEIDADAAAGNLTGLEVMAEEVTHGYPEVAAHAKGHLDNLKAKDALEQIAKGNAAHYQKEAYKKLAADPKWKALGYAEAYAQVQALYKQLQGAASQSAAVSLWKKAMLAGKVPSPAQYAAYKGLESADPQKAATLLAQVSDAIGFEKMFQLQQEAAGTPVKPFNAAAAAPAPADPIAQWKAFTSKNWDKVSDEEDAAKFVGTPDAGPAALMAFSSSGFVEINENPDSPVAQALLDYVGKLPDAKPSKMHRVLGFENVKQAKAFVDQLDEPQKRTLSSWTSKDPAAPGQTPMNNIALDLASHGDVKVFLSVDGPHGAKDVSFIYTKDGVHPGGTEYVLAKGAQLKVSFVKKKGSDYHVTLAPVAGDTGPKEGDTKEGADGTLVFKDGRWHKQGEDHPAAGLTGDADKWYESMANGEVPPPAQVKAFGKLDAKKQMALIEHLQKVYGHEFIGGLLSDQHQPSEAWDAYHAAQKKQQAAQPVGPFGAKIPALPDGWEFEENDPGFSGAASLTAQMPDGSTFYAVPNGDGGVQVGYLDDEGQPSNHFDTGNAADAAEWINGNLPQDDSALSAAHIEALLPGSAGAAKKGRPPQGEITSLQIKIVHVEPFTAADWSVYDAMSPSQKDEFNGYVAALSHAKQVAFKEQLSNHTGKTVVGAAGALPDGTTHHAPVPSVDVVKIAASWGISPDGAAMKKAAELAAAGDVAGLDALLGTISKAKAKTHGAVQAVLDETKAAHAPAAAPAEGGKWNALLAYMKVHGLTMSGVTKVYFDSLSPEKKKEAIQASAHFQPAAPTGWAYQVATNSFSGKASDGSGKLSVYAAHGGGYNVNHVSPTGEVDASKWFPNAEKVHQYLSDVSVSPPPELSELFNLHDGKSQPAAKPPRVASVKPSGNVTMTPVAEKKTVQATVMHNTSDGHNKQWAVSVHGSKLTTTYGPIGKTQQKTVKDMGSPGAAQLEKSKLINAKSKGGYGFAPGSTKVAHEYVVAPGAGDVPAASSPSSAEPKKPIVTAGTTFAASATAVQKALAEGNVAKIKEELDLVHGFMGEPAQKVALYAIAALKHLGESKPASVDLADWEGPKDGDTKRGANGGTLVFKDGYWHKVDQAKPAKPKALAQSDVDALMADVYGQKKPGTLPSNTVGKDAVKFAKAGDLAALKQHLKTADWKGKPNAKKLAMLLAEHMEAGTTPVKAAAKSSYDPAAEGEAAAAQEMSDIASAKAAKAAPAPAAPATPAKPTPGAGVKGSLSAPKIVSVQEIAAKGASDISGWKKTGAQEGSNEGGYYTDPQGVQWYCKFPKDPAAASTEILASKLYAACGLDVPELKAITRGGKPGIASRVLPLKKDAAALAGAAGMKDGFAVDAWLANWDVVGPDNTNTQLQGKKAVRVDVGGSLEFRAQGSKKADFGDKVLELDTLRNASKNPTAAKIFGSMSDKEIGESARHVFQLSDASITAMCMAYGPGTVDQKKALASKMIARKMDLAAKFPQVWKDYAPQQKIVIPDTPNFKEWNGPGKGLSSKAHVNQQNQEIAEEIHGLGVKGKVKQLQDFKFQPLHKDTGAPEGDMKPINDHPSQHIKKYHGDVLQAATSPVSVQSPLVKEAKVDVSGGGIFSALVSAFDDVKGLMAATHKLGRYAVLGRVEGGGLLDAWQPTEKSIKNKAISAKKLYDESHKNYATLSSVEKQAIKEYTSSGYASMNNASTGVGSHGKTDYAIGGVNKACVDLEEGTVLSRKFSFSSDSDMESMLKAEGAVIKDFGIISTALTPSTWSGNVHLRITCAKGAKGLYVAPDPNGGGGSISTHPGENEVILPYGTRFFVKKVHPKGTKFTDEHGSWGTGGPVVEVIALPPAP